jgi:hypothetical protein
MPRSSRQRPAGGDRGRRHRDGPDGDGAAQLAAGELAVRHVLALSRLGKIMDQIVVHAEPAQARKKHFAH